MANNLEQSASLSQAISLLRLSVRINFEIEINITRLNKVPRNLRTTADSSPHG